MLHELVETVLLPPEVLLDLLLVLLHPLHQVLLPLGLLLPLLLRLQLPVARLCVSEVLLVDGLTQLGRCLLGRNGDFSPVDLLDSGQVLGCSEVAVSSEAGNLPALGIVHLRILDCSVVISA
jgi:hypothetical protein